MWGDIPSGYQDCPCEDLIRDLNFGKQYDVCYYYTKPGDTTLYQGVDLKQTKGDILVKICSNHYMEGAVIYEHKHMLTPEEYLAGMRYNTPEAKQRMTSAQLHEVTEGVKTGIDEKALLRPQLTPSELRNLRAELERDNLRQQFPDKHFEATDQGAVELYPGFKSEPNYADFPDRVCYVPDLWDFDLGDGVTGKDILTLCNGDVLKAQMVFDRCDWQHPSTVLAEWDHEDDLALEEKRNGLSHQESLNDRLNAARDRVGNQPVLQNDVTREH